MLVRVIIIGPIKNDTQHVLDSRNTCMLHGQAASRSSQHEASDGMQENLSAAGQRICEALALRHTMYRDIEVTDGDR